MNVTAENILNYLYTKNGSTDPFKTVLDFIINTYRYAKGWRIIPRSCEYVNFVLDFLNVFTSDTIPTKIQEIIACYLEGADFTKCKTAPYEYITAVTEGAHAFAVDYKTACEKVATTRLMLNNSRPMFNIEENAAVCDYIDFIDKYRPEYSDLYFYGDLFNLGFIQGIRAERARHKGSALSAGTRTRAAAYAGIKHEKRYKTA